MGSSDSAPDKNLLPVQTGTIPEGMATLHKIWESLPIRWLYPKFWRGTAKEK